MEKIYFMPQWYFENKRIKRKKIIRILISIFFIIDLILIEVLFINVNKNKLLDQEHSEKIMIEKSEALKKGKIHDKNNRTIDTFLTFNKDVQQNINFETLYIEGKRVELILNSAKLDYMSFIKEIEIRNEFTIRQVTNETDNKVKIIMDLK